MRSPLRMLVRPIRQQSKFFAGILTGAILILVGSAGVRASIPDANNLIHACYTTGLLGKVRIIDSPSQTCNLGETAISWNNTTPGQLMPNLAGASLDGMDLRYRDFGGADLTGTSLQSANLVHTNLAGTNLTNANLANATLGHQDLSSTTFANVNLSGAILDAISFGSTSLSGLNFSSGTLSNDTGLSGRNFTSDQLDSTNFTSNDLTNTTFSGVDFGNTGLFNSNNLTGANFTGIKAPTGTLLNFSLDNLTNTKFNNALLGDLPSRFQLNGVTGSNTDFSGADLRGIAIGTSTSLTGANFTGANLSINATTGNAASIHDTTLISPNFTNTNLTGVVGLDTIALTTPVWSNTTCPDGTNSNANSNTCSGHLTP